MNVLPEFLAPVNGELATSLHPEHGKCTAVVRDVEMVGVSDKSWSDAARQIVARASQTLRHVTGLEVVHSSALVRDGKIAEYHVKARVAFGVEPAELET